MISDHVLQGLVSAQIHGATGQLNSDIASHRAKLMDRYMGEPYGDEVSGRSQIVMSDVSDTIEWIMPELMDIFTTGEGVVEFEPQGKEDEEAAKQETAVANHIVKKNNDFLLFYQWFKDALLQKNGIVKSFWDERTVEEIEEYADLTADEIMRILDDLAEADADIEVLEQSWDGLLNDQAPETAGMSLKIRVTRKVQEYRIVNVPPEEFLISPKWNSIFLEGCPFVAHKTTKTVSELIEMGFQRKQVETLPDDQEFEEQEEVERFNATDNSEYSDGTEADQSMREVQLTECYVYLDRNEDGVAELLQVFVGGGQNEVLLWADGEAAVDEVGLQPFDALTPVLISHKFYGRSIAEHVEDLQRIRTVLARQMLDNIYISNNARPHVDMNAVTDDTFNDLLNTQVGYPIRGKGPMAGVSYAPTPQMTPAILQGIEYIDHLRENRTGVTKYNQGLDANSLNKTATGIRSIMSASQKKILLIARIFAETGVLGVMRRMHRNLRKGPVKRLAQKIRNEWVEVNPRLWKERTDMSANVGLGTGDKDQILARLNAILERQIQAAQYGLASMEQIMHTLHKMVEAAGFKSPEMFFSLQQQQQPQQQGPSDIEVMAQTEMGKAQIKGQADIQREMIKSQTTMAKAELDAMHRSDQMRHDATKALMDDDRERDIALGNMAIELEKLEAQGVQAISLEALRAMMQPPEEAADLVATGPSGTHFAAG